MNPCWSGWSASRSDGNAKMPDPRSGTEVELLPERALYWPEAGLLAVADLHWGKPESFQQHGIPLPTGVLEDDLERLSRALRTRAPGGCCWWGTSSTRAGASRPPSSERITTWRAGHDVEMVLVRGNHDRHLKTLPPEWRMEVQEEHADEGPFRFAHHPEPAAGRYCWAGHLHPMVRLPRGADRLRLPCFHLGPA